MANDARTGLVLVDRYQLGVRLGRGATADVYLAVDRQSGRSVAVKLMGAAAAADPRVVRRFDREVTTASAIRHPAVVSLLAAHTSHSPPFLVMEYVTGSSLRAFLDRTGSMGEPLVIAIARRIAEGLDAIHRAGVVHRDIKPENLLLTAEDEIRIVDLGVAHLLAPDPPANATWPARLTFTADFVGTPAYAAPEQFTGGRVGSGADLYSLGVVLFEAATGTNPFRADGLYEQMRRHQEVVAPAASSLRPELSPLLDGVIATLLEKVPERRFSSASELASVLGQGRRSAWWRRRAAGERARKAHAEEPVPRRARTPYFVGREAELEELIACCDRARSSTGSFVLLVGEPGIGKSQLLHELAASLEQRREDLTILHGGYSPDGFGGAIAGLARGLVRHFGDDQVEIGVRSHLGRTPGLVPAFVALLTGAQIPSGVGSLAQEGINAAFCSLALGLSRVRPLIWLVDDIHFASPEGRAVLYTLARLVSTAPLVIVAATRPGLPPEDLALLARIAAFRRIDLGRLTCVEVEHLIERMSGSALSAHRLAREILRRTDGVPFFLVELLRELTDRGVGEEALDGSEVILPGIPVSVRDLLRARLASLSEEERALIDVGAVCGFAFDPDLVARVERASHLMVLRRLATVERRTGMVRGTSEGFRFDHHLLLELVLEEMPPVLRARYHALVADGLADREACGETRADPTAGSGAVLVCEHALRGDRPDSSERWILAALRYLSDQFRHRAVQDLAERFNARASGADDRLRAEVLLTLGRSLWIVGDIERWQTTIDKAIELADLAGDEVLTLRVRLQLGIRHTYFGDGGQAQRILEDIVARAGPRDPSIGMEALGLLGLVLDKRGEHDRARSCLEQQLRYLRRQDNRHGQAQSLGWLALVLLHQGHPRRARRAWERQEAISRDIGRPFEEAMALANLGVLSLQEGRLAKARDLGQKHYELSTQMGHRRGVSRTNANLGAILYALGDYGEARSRFATYLSLSQELSDRQGEVIALVNLSTLDLEEGDDEAAAERHAIARRAVTKLDDPRLEAEVEQTRGQALRFSDPAAARAHYEVALAIYRRTCTPEGIATAALSIARLLLDCDDPVAAEPLLTESALISRSLTLSMLGSLADAYLVRIGRKEASAVRIARTAPVAVRAETHAVLYAATGDERNRRAARRLLQVIAAGVQPEARKRLLHAHPAARVLDRCQV